MSRRFVLVASVLHGLLISGCEYYARPNRELPKDFKAYLLSGQVLDRQSLRGHPWVIAIWVPE